MGKVEIGFFDVASSCYVAPHALAFYAAASDRKRCGCASLLPGDEDRDLVEAFGFRSKGTEKTPAFWMAEKNGRSALGKNSGIFFLRPRRNPHMLPPAYTN